MPQYDEPLEALQSREPTTAPPPDLGLFWSRTLKASRESSWRPKITPISTPLTVVDTFDVTFAGFAGHPVKAWFRRPVGAAGDLPVVIEFAGYSGGRGLSHQAGVWSLSGYAELIVDTRGQGAGGGWSGETGDDHEAGPSFPGFMTRGIHDPDSYYFRRVFTDGVLAVDAVRGLHGVDGSRVVVSGTSQGAGIALAVASLSEGIAATMANVPFLCDFPRSVAFAAEGPYTEVAAYLATRRWDVERTFRTLSYFDIASLASRASAPALFSVALSDRTCPPSGVYAAYNVYGGDKSIRIYPYNDHEGGQFHQEAEQLAWLPDMLDSAPRTTAMRSEDAPMISSPSHDPDHQSHTITQGRESA